MFSHLSRFPLNIGYSLDELHLRTRCGANVIGIERWHRFRRLMLSVTAATELHERDVLLVDMSDSEVDLNEFCHEQKLAPMILRCEGVHNSVSGDFIF